MIPLRSLNLLSVLYGKLVINSFLLIKFWFVIFDLRKVLSPLLLKLLSNESINKLVKNKKSVENLSSDQISSKQIGRGSESLSKVSHSNNHKYIYRWLYLNYYLLLILFISQLLFIIIYYYLLLILFIYFVIF